MVCVRFLSLLLLLSLAALEGSAAIHNGNKVLGNCNHAIVTNKVTQMKQEIEAMRTSKQRRSVRGRKMGVEDVMIKKEAMKGRILKKGGCKKINEGMKGKFSVECELRVTTRRPPASSVQLVGMIPFSSDYHAPKTHPPKNN